MSEKVTEHHARVVVTGMDESGRSRIVRDAAGEVRWPSPVATSTVVWEALKLPVVTGAESDEHIDRYLPETGGVKVFITAIAPDEEWADDADEAYGETKSNAGIDDMGADRPPSFHQTPTVDIITVISGEIYALMDDGEVLLKQGDTLIQRGTPHGWSNRSGELVVMSGVMVGAVPPADS